MKPRFFRSPADLRAWLEGHHNTDPELWIGFHKKGSGKGGVTLGEAQDEAICFGWIDGVARRIDETRYTIRFTPRRPGSTWSVRNIERVRTLKAEGRMAPAGLEVFEARDEAKTRQYSYEREAHRLDPTSEREFRANPRAWAFFEAQTPSYRRTATWWVMSAKREETRRRRLSELIESSEQETQPRPFIRPTRPGRAR